MIAESGVWKTWTAREIFLFQLSQEYLCVPFSTFHEAVEKVFGRPVYDTELVTIDMWKEFVDKEILRMKCGD